MKKCLLITILIAVCNLAYSQDLIVTSKGDSLNCKITKLKGEYIYFTFNYNEKIMNTLLLISDIDSYQYAFYPMGEVTESTPKIVNYPRFRFVLNGGYSYLTAKISNKVPQDLTQHIKDMKSGYHFGGDVIGYFDESLGVGLKGIIFSSSNSIDNVAFIDENSNYSQGTLNENLKITFIGPTFSVRTFNLNRTNCFIMNLSAGYMGYTNDVILIDKYKITGGTVGFVLDFGYDIELSKNLALGFQLSVVRGALEDANISKGGLVQRIELEKENQENLSRIDFSIGLRFGK